MDIFIVKVTLTSEDNTLNTKYNAGAYSTHEKAVHVAKLIEKVVTNSITEIEYFKLDTGA